MIVFLIFFISLVFSISLVRIEELIRVTILCVGQKMMGLKNRNILNGDTLLSDVEMLKGIVIKIPIKKRTEI